MKPEIIQKKGLTLLGMKYEGSNENDEIFLLWYKFLFRLKEITNVVNPKVFYGYDTWTSNINETGEFTYLAAVEVEDDSCIPEDMVCLSIPNNKYAVFELDSKVEDVGKKVKEIYSKWLPESGYKLNSNYDFEYYNETFRPDDKESSLYFYIPVK